MGRWECAGGGGQLSKGSQVLEGFVDDEEKFEVDYLRDREPAEVLKNRSDVVTGLGVGEQQSLGYF